MTDLDAFPEPDSKSSRDDSPERKLHCGACKRSTCGNPTKFKDKTYCCQCYWAVSGKFSIFPSKLVKYCKPCGKLPFCCAECYRTDCSLMDEEYVMAEQGTGQKCCICTNNVRTKGGCGRCREIEEIESVESSVEYSESSSKSQKDEADSSESE